MSVIVEDHLNYAYNQYIIEKYDSLINPAEKFEITERITRILAPLLADFTEVTTFTSTTVNSPYGYYVTGPTELQYIVKDYATIRTTDCNGDTVQRRARIIPMKHKMVESNKNNPFLAPSDEIDAEIWRLTNSGNTRMNLAPASPAFDVAATAEPLTRHSTSCTFFLLSPCKCHLKSASVLQ